MARFSKAQAGESSQKAINPVENGAFHGNFVRRGQSWFCTTGLPCNISVEVDEMLFHLHKFPLISRSGKISQMVADATSSDDDADEISAITYQKPPHHVGICHIALHGMPGGADTFELVAKFCYGVKVELMASNVAALRCAAEYLHMTEEYGEHNLIGLTENFLNNVIIRSWKDSVTTLKSCELLLPLAEELSLVNKCVDSIVTKVCTEPSIYGWPAMDPKRTLQSPRGKLLWSDSRSRGRAKDARVDWWYEDVSVLNLPLFKCVIHSMEDKGLTPEAIAGALMYYARKCIPGMHRRQEGSNGRLSSAHSISSSNAEQLFCLETIESLLPLKKGLLPTAFLSSLLKVAMILNAEKSCLQNLEKRVGAQLEQATVDDILIPNYSEFSETLYDVDCVERLVQHFVDTMKAVVLQGHAHDTHLSRSSSSTFPSVAVAKLVDSYLVEIASDVNLLPAKFQAVLESLPHDARVLDDGMYQALDVYLKAHPWVEDTERDALCSLISCEKLTQAACKHAAQNTRLPLRIVAQLLFLEQAQLRAAFAGVLEGATVRTSGADSQPALENSTLTIMPPAWRMGDEERISQPQVGQLTLHADLTTLRYRIAELERQCSGLRRRLQRKAVGWSTLSSKLSCQSLSHTELPVSSTKPRRRRSSSSVSSTPRIG